MSGKCYKIVKTDGTPPVLTFITINRYTFVVLDLCETTNVYNFVALDLCKASIQYNLAALDLYETSNVYDFEALDSCETTFLNYNKVSRVKNYFLQSTAA